jgi:tRNA G18 (ribose-2'-O)-methylase SpoU
MLPEHIASLDDPRIAEYRHIANPAAIERAGLFVAEGRFVVARLLSLDRFRVRSVLLTPPAAQSLAAEMVTTKAAVFVIDQSLMNAIVGFNIHRGCLALAERAAAGALESLPLPTLKRALVLEGVNNPDNVGGLFRSAAAFAVEAVLLGPACGDPLYRKAIRTSMAATLRVPFVTAAPWPAALGTLRAHGLSVFGLTTAPEARALDTLPRNSGPLALLVGNEGEGLSDAALAACNEPVRIPMMGGIDSLNATVAASIAMHHFFADRRSPIADR